MARSVPNIYLIAGCNGAGKTTFAKEFLPKEVKCLHFLNADEMARGLSPLDPSAGAVKAARLLLREVHEAIRDGDTFGLESTIARAELPLCTIPRYLRSNRSRFITFVHAATKSATNFFSASELA